MKLVRFGMIFGGISLVAISVAVNMYLAMRLEAGLPVSAYQQHFGDFLSALAIATILISLGIGMLFFPEQIAPWYDEMYGRKPLDVYPPIGLFLLRISGLFLVITMLVFLGIDVKTTSVF
jgi:hypothetical protein